MAGSTSGLVTAEEVAQWVRYAWDNGPPDDDLTAWTVHVNSCFSEHAKAKGLEAFGKGLGKRRGEYLVDHCWSEPWTGMETYRGLQFAAEFEWGGTRSAIEEDVIKLADIRAPARLFLGTLWSAPWSAAEDIATEVGLMLKAHGVARGDWIVLALGPKGKAEVTEPLKVWKVTTNGAVGFPPRS